MGAAEPKRRKKQQGKTGASAGGQRSLQGFLKPIDLTRDDRAAGGEGPTRGGGKGSSPAPATETRSPGKGLSSTWLQDRLIGRDVEGTLDAQAKWGERRMTKLTSTEMAITNHRNAQTNKQTSGWRNVDGKKVFVVKMNGVTKQAEGAEGFRLSMAYGKKGSASVAKKNGSKK